MESENGNNQKRRIGDDVGKIGNAERRVFIGKQVVGGILWNRRRKQRGYERGERDPAKQVKAMDTCHCGSPPAFIMIAMMVVGFITIITTVIPD